MFYPIFRFTAATIMKITYGADVKSNDDPFVQLGWLFIVFVSELMLISVLIAQRAGSLTIQSGTPAATLVDYIPIMRCVES